MWTLPELHYTPKREYVRLPAIVQERIPWALVDPRDQQKSSLKTEIK